MKKAIITQSNYIPWKGYFDAINTVDEFIIYDDMQYTKRDWRNRNKIKTPNEVIWLSIPVEVKGKFFQKIKDTQISDPEWNKNHWATIKHNYAKAKHFNEYKDIFENAYLNCNYKFLSEINYHFIKIICDLLDIKTSIRWSSEFDLAEGKTEKLVDLCVKIGATDYFSGPAAKNYMEENLFTEKNINVHYFDYSGYPPYTQLYGDFTHEVTILDLLFNEGPAAKKFMKSFH